MLAGNMRRPPNPHPLAHSTPEAQANAMRDKTKYAAIPIPLFFSPTSTNLQTPSPPSSPLLLTNQIPIPLQTLHKTLGIILQRRLLHELKIRIASPTEGFLIVAGRAGEDVRELEIRGAGLGRDGGEEVGDDFGGLGGLVGVGVGHEEVDPWREGGVSGLLICLGWGRGWGGTREGGGEMGVGGLQIWGQGSTPRTLPPRVLVTFWMLGRMPCGV